MKYSRFVPIAVCGLLLCPGVWAQMDQGLNREVCYLIFPGTNDCKQLADGNGQEYAEAWYRGGVEGPPDKFFGYVFPKEVQDKVKRYKLLIGITEYRQSCQCKGVWYNANKYRIPFTVCGKIAR